VRQKGRKRFNVSDLCETRPVVPNPSDTALIVRNMPNYTDLR
jgi:hypothetical protein